MSLQMIKGRYLNNHIRKRQSCRRCASTALTLVGAHSETEHCSIIGQRSNTILIKSKAVENTTLSFRKASCSQYRLFIINPKASSI